MNKFKFIFALVLFIESLNSQNLKELYKSNLPSVVKISVLHNDGTLSNGTGFFIDSKTIVSCYHVCENVNTITIKNSKGTKFTADSVIYSNRNADVIKFTVKETNKTWLKFSEGSPEPGESVVVIGNPESLDFSISNGIVSGVRINNTIKVIQTTAPCSEGNSGSPLLNSEGKVLGIVSYIKFLGQNLNFAISADYLTKTTDDNTIQTLSAPKVKVSKQELDSLLKTGMIYYNNKMYDKAIQIIAPLFIFMDSTQSIRMSKTIGDSYFHQLHYDKAAKYYEYMLPSFSDTQRLNSSQSISLVQILNNLAHCYFGLGNKVGSIDFAEKAITICLIRLETETFYKEIFTNLIQQAYISDATFKFAADRTIDACLSWKIAKQYGHKGDEYGFNALCK